jgi:uncharacterized protein (TIGR03437 family)
MKYTIIVFSLALIGATAAYPQVTLNPLPSRSVGTPIANSNTVEGTNPNLVEGKELFSPWAVAVDSSLSPPILYVSDTKNNRVLGWKNALSFTNGQPADLVIGQQDFAANDPQGPGHKFSVGLWFPSGLAVSSTGDLYVADTNNSRVLRFPKPFQHVTSTPAVLTNAPDLFLGQPSLSSRTANFTGQVSAQGLSLGANYPANMAFDGNGSLWICDTANYRVLGFKAATLATTGGSVPADIVIGQPNMTTNTGLTSGLQTTNQFAGLAGIAVDPQGRLYVGDNLGNALGQGRVLVFSNPTALASNASADRLMGVFPPNSPNPTLTAAGTTEFNVPEGIFFFPDTSDTGGDCGSAAGCSYVGVLDSNLSRATIFPPYSKWPALPAPPQAIQPGGVIGQALSFTTFGPNASTSTTITTPPASASVLFGPVGAMYLNSSKELFIADTDNNRVIVMPLQPQPGNPVNFGNATRVLGQISFDQFSANYIEGKEFSFSSGAGIALDLNGTTPHLYVADTLNHRVLGFKDARKISPNLFADIVIGQPDFGHALCNYPSGDSSKPKQNNLCGPVGIAVDPQGNLYVADSGNGRVLRFPAPFSYTGTMEPADLVLGQQDFVTQVLDPTASTMRTPYGLAFSGTNGLLVSDLGLNRVLYFPFTANNTFTGGTDNGKVATKVYGQQDFFGINSGTASNQLSAPHHIAADTSGRLYVADTGNNRILIFDDPNSALTPTGGDSAPVALTQGISQPFGVYVNPSTGEVWVANSGQGAVVRYPLYDTLSQNQASLTTISDIATDPEQSSGAIQFAPFATVQDQFGDLFVADNGNRITTYYQNLSVVNGASFLSYRLLAPGTAASIFPAKNGSASQFGSNTAIFSTVPVPTTLGDVQVTVNGTSAPLFYTSPGQINFVFPFNAPTSGTAEVDVIQASTGQIFGTGVVGMDSVSPGVFQCPASAAALRQACILNEDSTPNSFTNPALRGHLIQIFGTGQGVVPNAPPDGTPASGAIPSPIAPRVLINGLYPEQYQTQPGDPSNGQFVQYFGLAPGLVGLWQLNLQIPMAVTPSSQTGNATQFEVNLNNVFDTDINSGFHMSFVVK